MCLNRINLTLEHFVPLLLILITNLTILHRRTLTSFHVRLQTCFDSLNCLSTSIVGTSCPDILNRKWHTCWRFHLVFFAFWSLRILSRNNVLSIIHLLCLLFGWVKSHHFCYIVAAIIIYTNIYGLRATISLDSLA